MSREQHSRRFRGRVRRVKTFVLSPASSGRTYEIQGLINLAPRSHTILKSEGLRRPEMLMRYLRSPDRREALSAVLGEDEVDKIRKWAKDHGYVL